MLGPVAHKPSPHSWVGSFLSTTDLATPVIVLSLLWTPAAVSFQAKVTLSQTYIVSHHMTYDNVI